VASQGHGLGKLVALLALVSAVAALAYARRDRDRPRDPDEPHVDAPTIEVSFSTSSRRTKIVGSAAGVPSLPSAIPTAEPAPSASSPAAGTEPPLYASGDVTYAESIDCHAMPSLAAAREAYAPGQTRKAAEAIANARYPDGLPFLQAQSDEALKTWFIGAPDTFDGAASRFDAAVHEGSHVWGAKTFRGRTRAYSLRGDLTIETSLPKTFDRSEILARHVDRASDPYAKTYLEGSSGAQGFDTLLDEYVAYAHGLAARWCTRDLLPEGQRVSARDGVLAFMYYVEVYLEIARTAHPKDYAAIVGDAGARKVIVTNWDRAERFLRASAGERALGVHDETLRAWVYEPARLAEIAKVRAIGGK
jgi:hypothetical protein